MPKITEIRHPQYTEDALDWEKWRLAYEGGRLFINRYLYKLSKREQDDDLLDRKNTAYCPAFAAEAVTEIKDSIYQRMVDVSRAGGPESYVKAIKGDLGGVDLNGLTMNTFMGAEILPELLVMKRVGALVDNAEQLGRTLQDKGNKHPYVSLYRAESICSWSYRFEGSAKILESVLLRESVEDVYEDTGLPMGLVERYRFMKLESNGVKVILYNTNSEPQKEYRLDLPEIPFHIFDIPQSMMKNIADYQIALLNLESSDISYARKSNYPFYYEFYDPKAEQTFSKPITAPGGDGTQSVQAAAKDTEIRAGNTYGRRFPVGAQQPGFINPDPDTLRVSMEKGEQLKADIRKLVSLNLQNIGQQRQSAESKQEDQRGLESSLSFIGLILETGENQIGRFWSMFEGSEDIPKVQYPKNYSLKSEKDRQDEAEKLEEALPKIASPTYKKVIAKQIVEVRLGHKVKPEELKKMFDEIDAAKTLNSDTDQILQAHEQGLVDDKTATVALGYPEDVIEQARKDRAERIKLTLEAQGGPQGDGAARGAPEFGGKDGSQEKDLKPKRGEEK